VRRVLLIGAGIAAALGAARLLGARQAGAPVAERGWPTLPEPEAGADPWPAPDPAPFDDRGGDAEAVEQMEAALTPAAPRASRARIVTAEVAIVVLAVLTVIFAIKVFSA
jgi:hypothetical protein